MATYRIGIGSFNLKDGAVGIGTESSGLGNLKVEGTYKVTDLDVTGVSTFTRYAGFAPDNLEVGKDSRDRTLTGEHQTTGDIVVGVNSTFTVSVGATVNVGTVPSVSIGTHFSPPTGGVEDRPEVPVEGTVRYNRDLNTLEFYNGIEWRQFTVSGASGRGFQIGGYKPGVVHKYVQTFNIATGGETTYFGKVAMGNAYETAGFGSRTRAFNATDGSYSQQIDYYTVATQSDGIDFGNLTVTGGYGSALSSQTRGVIAAGYIHPSPGANSNVIDYVEMATVGNAVDFGDNTRVGNSRAGLSDGIRGVWAGNGGSPDPSTTVDLNIISSKGNAVDYGDTSYNANNNGASNNVRGILANINGLDSYQLASGGNSIEFGDRETNMHQPNSTASHTRVVIAGGRSPSTFTDSLEYVNIASTGNSVNFGNLSDLTASGAGYSDSHGGLGGF